MNISPQVIRQYSIFFVVKLLMLNFDINNQINARIDPLWLKKIVNAFDKAAKIKAKSNFSLAFIGGAQMKKWNRVYRNKNKITDVLSFAENDNEIIMPSEANYLGEILICWTQAKRQAEQYGTTIEQEIARLLIHGLAHLIGYEHEGVSKSIAKKMFDFEKQVRDRIGKYIISYK